LKKILTADNTYSAYSNIYKEYYHSIDDGALKESLNKHVLPALKYHKSKQSINVLDICFGLGYNTFATLLKLKNSNKSIHIVSPELDLDLLRSLQFFNYPSEFEFLREIIVSLSTKLYYKDTKIEIEIINKDAREVIKEQKYRFDVIYQDAFSPTKNPSLWTYEYFKDLRRIMSDDCILTTYSIATPVRMGLFLNSMHIYTNDIENMRKSTLAFNQKCGEYKYIDMVKKQLNNPNAKAFYDDKSY